MHVPTSVWNAIAESQPLGQPWATLFRATPETLPGLLEKLVDKPLTAKGADNRVLLAYRLTAPLLTENEAISAYLIESNRQELRSSMPELTSVSEAVTLASREFRLLPSQQTKLRTLLSEAMQT